MAAISLTRLRTLSWGNAQPVFATCQFTTSLLLRLAGLVLGCLVSTGMFWSIVSGRLDKRCEARLRLDREREELRVQQITYQ